MITAKNENYLSHTFWIFVSNLGYHSIVFYTGEITGDTCVETPTTTALTVTSALTFNEEITWSTNKTSETSEASSKQEEHLTQISNKGSTPFMKTGSFLSAYLKL